MCDASWSTGASILSSVVGAPHQKRQQQQNILESRLTYAFSHSRTLVVPGTFLRVLYNNIHHHVAFARDLEEKKNTEQDQPAVRSAVAAPAPAPAAAPAEVRFSMTCRFVDAQGKRGNVRIAAIMPVAFPDVVVFDGFI